MPFKVKNEKHSVTHTHTSKYTLTVLRTQKPRDICSVESICDPLAIAW